MLAVGKPDREVIVEVGSGKIFRLAGMGWQQPQLLRLSGNNRSHPFEIGRQAPRGAVAETDGGRTVGGTHVGGILLAAAVALFREENPLAVRRDAGDEGPILPAQIGFRIVAGKETGNPAAAVCAN